MSDPLVRAYTITESWPGQEDGDHVATVAYPEVRDRIISERLAYAKSEGFQPSGFSRSGGTVGISTGNWTLRRDHAVYTLGWFEEMVKEDWVNWDWDEPDYILIAGGAVSNI